MEEANAERLRSRYDRLTAVLDQGGIRYLDAGAGLFLWIDLRPFLSYGDSGPPQRENSGLWAGAVGVEEALLPAREAEQRRSHEIRVTESRNGESESTGGGGASPLPAPHPRVRPSPHAGRVDALRGARPLPLRLLCGDGGGLRGGAAALRAPRRRASRDMRRLFRCALRHSMDTKALAARVVRTRADRPPRPSVHSRRNFHTHKRTCGAWHDSLIPYVKTPLRNYKFL